MPELPDVTVYVESLTRLLVGRRLVRVRIVSPFFVRSVEPSVFAAEGRLVRGVERLGKRIVVELDGNLFLVVHLMIAGRFHWRPVGAKASLKVTNACLDFDHGSLHVTEASSKKRASLHAVLGRSALEAFRPEGVEPLACTRAEFEAALRRENHTLKRALTDPRIVSGVGNAYSDEILHRARLSPFLQTRNLDTEAAARLHEAARAVLSEWVDRLRRDVGDGFPEKVTAFRPEMAAHGRFGKPCPVCSTPIQRIRYAENEANYCPTCQTEGRLLRDRGLSRLLKDDWPATLDEMERRIRGG